MPKFDKPDSPNIIWGVNALDANLTKPSDSYIQTGWTQVKPPYEYENYSMNKLYRGFAYYNQLGFPEWDSSTEYQAGKSYVQGSNDRVYKCIQTHSNKNPATAGNESWWELFEGNRQATTASRGTVELATNTETSTGTSSTHAVTPSNLLNGLLGDALLSGNGYMRVPVNVSGERKTVVVAWCSNTGSVGTNIGDSTDITVNYPITISNIVHLQLSHGIASNSEGAEMSYSIVGSGTSSATARFLRVSGSNTGGETVRASFLVIGYDN